MGPFLIATIVDKNNEGKTSFKKRQLAKTGHYTQTPRLGQLVQLRFSTAIGFRSGHRSLHPRTPTRSRYFYPCADSFSEFFELMVGIELRHASCW
jgi:hypothetical protein